MTVPPLRSFKSRLLLKAVHAFLLLFSILFPGPAQGQDSSNHAPTFSGNPLSEGYVGFKYTSQLLAYDSDAGDRVTYLKISGPAWLTINAGGSLDGTPGISDLGTNLFVVRATDSGGLFTEAAMELPIQDSNPMVYFRMDELSGPTVSDETHHELQGALINGPTRDVGRFNRAIKFDGTNQHVKLPDGIVSTLNDFTISTWVNRKGTAYWGRVFDFGTGPTNYMFLTTRTPEGKARFGIRTPDGPEQYIDGPSLPLDSWSHLAITLSGNTGIFYYNGNFVGIKDLTLKPSSLGVTTANYLGRSQFSVDPYLNGLVDEFKIYDRALTANQIRELATAIPTPTGLVATAAESGITLNWNPALGGIDYYVKRATVSGGPYEAIAPHTTARTYQDTTATPGTVYYYVVSALKPFAQGGDSVEVSASALTALQGWRRTWFGTVDPTGNAADEADPDGDGWSNANEFASGTDPTRRESKLAINSMAIGTDGLVLSFPSVAGRHYSVEYSSTLAPESWRILQTSNGPAEGIVGTGDPIQVTDGTGVSQQRFYRLVAQP